MEDSSQIVVRFKRLMRDLETGSPLRTCFRPWEIELLLDFQSCDVRGPTQRRTLRRYTRAALRNVERGAGVLKLSDYLAQLKRKPCGSVVGPASASGMDGLKPAAG